MNLAEVARRYGISRDTLHSWIKDDPQLAEALCVRRETFGRGYTQRLRGTPATRQVAAVRAVERVVQAALPRAPVLGGRLGLPEEWREDSASDAEKAEAINACVAATVRPLPPRPARSRTADEQAQVDKQRAAMRAAMDRMFRRR